MSGSRVPAIRKSSIAPADRVLPVVVNSAGHAGGTAWKDFFDGRLGNGHTRRAYECAVRQFCRWCHEHELELHQVTPGHVGTYFRSHSGAAPTRKQHLAALRRFFNLLVERHIVLLNPAAATEVERYATIEGKTPEITRHQARKLLASIDVSHVVGLRDRAIIAILIYTAARIGAVAKLRVRDFYHDGEQWHLHFDDKGGKSREIPARHDLQAFVHEYMDAGGVSDKVGVESALLRTVVGRTRTLTSRGMSDNDIARMIKRRMKDAGLPKRLSAHSFRVATITDLLELGAHLHEVQYLAGHADPRTTRLYDRRQRRVTRNIVERISI